jgi:multidrug efflux system membrane fusion protein
MNRRSYRVLGWVPAALLAGAGCNHGPPAIAPAQPPVVPVSHPVERPVTDYVDYTGRTAAVLAVDVRARVSGYLVKMPFREGAEVERGQMLFEIDPSPYQAQFDAAKAQVGVAEAALRLARVTYERNRIIAAREPGAVSQQELDQYRAQQDQAAANLNLAQANLETARLRLDWTKVNSLIDGQISRYFLTLGNLVSADQTLLTTIVSLDPIYVYFDVDERTVIRVRKGINAGNIRVPVERTDIPVHMGLEGEEGYPHQGTLDFVNNAVTPSTGTILVRAVFPNPLPNVTQPRGIMIAYDPRTAKPEPDLDGRAGRGGKPDAQIDSARTGKPESRPENSAARKADAVIAENRPRAGRRLLSPGMFVRVRLPIGEPHEALLVIDRAVGFDQGMRFVYVLDKDNKVVYRRVSTGPLEDDGLRVIDGGDLHADDRVVVGALQQIRPGMVVQPDEIAMPTIPTPAGGQAPSTVPGKPQPPPSGGKAR